MKAERIYTKSDFGYSLPSDLIASKPTRNRSGSRLLRLDGDNVSHFRFTQLPQLLRPGDVVVVNDTKVIKARLFGSKTTGGKTEILIERIESECVALCHVKSSRGFKIGHEVRIGQFLARLVDRERDLHRVSFDGPISLVMEQCGHVPLPQYIQRPDTDEDEARYQTIYAKEEGAVAAPTAGLHFDAKVLEDIQEMEVRLAPITLHVGAGTFQPLRTNDLSNVAMHAERYVIPPSTRRVMDQAERIVAVGTTVVRTLESAELSGEDQGETQLFISPGFEFRAVDVLITNFHLPESTLLMLVCAFAGYNHVMKAYRAAIEERYRFFSYGDAMLCERDAI